MLPFRAHYTMLITLLRCKKIRKLHNSKHLPWIKTRRYLAITKHPNAIAVSDPNTMWFLALRIRICSILTRYSLDLLEIKPPCLTNTNNYSI